MSDHLPPNMQALYSDALTKLRSAYDAYVTLQQQTGKSYPQVPLSVGDFAATACTWLLASCGFDKGFAILAANIVNERQQKIETFQFITAPISREAYMDTINRMVRIYEHSPNINVRTEPKIGDS